MDMSRWFAGYRRIDKRTELVVLTNSEKGYVKNIYGQST